ncbi:BTAD domain-containing putative transcriptional regulator [Agromyces protaetiae]|uniref:nSTAND1 domain-containing NTPase n=1 Tax=Agromyces protaetiae TaxID=2509455 RepID=UPI0013EBF969|nr:BTAD domain-containing putative transcriptional regulator [Agromyces protaetiae]
MSVDVLGPLVVDGGPISPRERSALAALVLAGGVVSADELGDAVWGDAPPPTWSKQVQIAIGRLRRHPGVPAIETAGGGYRAVVSRDDVDAARFERDVGAGIDHLRDGAPDRAVAAFERALALWRGRPYADLADWPPAIAEARRLGELRAVAEEERVAALSELGESARAIGDAERLVAEAPLRERRWSALALALYRGGRQADALAAIREAKRRLADELGVEPGAELAALETAVLRHDVVLDGTTAPAQSAECPYRGLAVFDEDDEEAFFGREREVRAALARIDRSTLVAFAGPSGCGKSSIVRAGIVPVLRRRARRAEIILPRRSTASTVRDLDARLDPGDAIIVDQFEELLHLGLPSDEIESVCRVLAEFAARGGRVLVTVRSDFLDECARLPHLGASFRDAVHLVAPIDPDGLRSAIVDPAREAGLRIEPGLVELILRDAEGRPGALPLVSHALVETWLRRDGATLTVAGYEAAGGLSEAIAQSADRLYHRMSGAQRALCRATMLRLVALADDGSPIRRPLPVRSVHGDAERDEVLALLADARLVSADDATIVVTHEALATAWPRLRGWLHDDAETQRTMHALANAAGVWDAGGRADADLYRGARLAAALEWRDSDGADPTDSEIEFLDAGAALEASERRELAEREQRERRQNRRLRAVLAAAVALIVLLVGAGSVAIVSAVEADRQRTAAGIGSLVSTALALRTSERDVAALLAAEAYRRSPDDPRTQAGLMGVLATAGGFLGNAFVDGATTIYGVRIPDREQAVVFADDGSGGIRDLATADLVRPLDLGFDPEFPAPYPLIELSGDGRTAAVLWSSEREPAGVTWYGTSLRSKLVVFDLDSGERTLGPLDLDIGTGSLEVSHDGGLAAVADSTDGHVVLVDLADGAVRDVGAQSPKPIELDSYAAALLFDDARRLLIGRVGSQIEIVDPESSRVTGAIDVPQGSANVAMANTTNGVIVASGDHAIIAFDPSDGRVEWTRPLTNGYPASCPWIAVSEPADTVFCAGPYGRIARYALDDGMPAGPPLDALLGTVGQISVSSDGSELAAVGILSAISRWRLDGTGLANRLVGRGMYALWGGYADEGSSLLVAPRVPGELHDGSSRSLSVLDTGDDRLVSTLDRVLGDPSWAGERRIVAWHEAEQVIRIIDSDTGAAIGEPLDGVERTWTTDRGTRIFALFGDGRLVPYDSATAEPNGPPIVVEGWPVWLSVSPDGRRVAITHVTDDRELMLSIADASTGAILRSTRDGIGAHALFDDGTLIGANDNRILRMDTSREPFIQTGTLPGGAGGFGVPTLSDDGRTFLMTSAGGMELLYDLPSGTQLGDPFIAESPTLTGAFLRPDGGELALNVADGIMVWNLDSEAQFEAVCRIAGRELSADEWRTYLPDAGVPRATCG